MSLKIFSASKLARSLFFIGFVGGLLFCLSYTFSYIANHYLYNQLGLTSPVTILEVAGIASFVYVLLFGIKFGFSRAPRYDEITYTQIQMNEFANANGHSETEDCDKLQQKYSANINQLSEEEKERLKQKLAEMCGIEEPIQNGENNSR